MGVIKGWTMTQKSLTEEGNNMKEVFLKKFNRRGISQKNKKMK